MGGVTDHVHLFFGTTRTLSIAQIVEKVKVASSKWIKERDEQSSAFHWQSGYGIFSVSQSEADKVEHYVATQEEHHRAVTFQEEFRKFLQRHRIEYDERYVWE